MGKIVLFVIAGVTALSTATAVTYMNTVPQPEAVEKYSAPQEIVSFSDVAKNEVSVNADAKKKSEKEKNISGSDEIPGITIMNREDFSKEYNETKEMIDSAKNNSFKDEFYESGGETDLDAIYNSVSRPGSGNISSGANISMQMPAASISSGNSGETLSMTGSFSKTKTNGSEPDTKDSSGSEKKDNTEDPMEKLSNMFKDVSGEGESSEPTKSSKDQESSEVKDSQKNDDSSKTDIGMDIEPIDIGQFSLPEADADMTENMPEIPNLTMPDIKDMETKAIQDIKENGSSVISEVSGLSIDDVAGNITMPDYSFSSLDSEYNSLISEYNSKYGTGTDTSLYSPSLGSMPDNAIDVFESSYGKYNLGSSVTDFKIPDNFSSPKLPSMDSLQASLPELPAMNNPIANLATEKLNLK